MHLVRDFYVGIVEDNKDPNRKGRIKVRVQTLYHNIAVEDIPYAYPWGGISGKDFQIPAIGKLVNILFLSDDLYSPYYIYSENYNVNLQNKLKDLSDEDYVDFIALLFDEKTQIYVKNNELTIDQLLNKITINNTSINHELKDNTQTLNLGSKNSEQDAVLGTRFFKWMDKFIAELMNPNSMIDSNGAAVMKPKLYQLCKQYQATRSSRLNFTSEHVKIVDNGKVSILKRYPTTINNRNDMDLVMPPEINRENQKRLDNAIKATNDKACETLKDAAPTTNIPLQQDPNLAPGEIGQVWDKSSQRIIETLHPDVRPYAVSFLNSAEASGIKLRITSGFRSYDEQTALYNKGRTTRGSIVTKAKAGESYHNFGVAIDVVQIVGKRANWDSDQWQTIGEIGKSVGFSWGGDWKGFVDNPHFEMPFGLKLADLRNRYESKDFVNGYVNLGDSKKPTNQQYQGQNYADSSTSSTKPCPGTDTDQKINTDGSLDTATPVPPGGIKDLVFADRVKENKQEFLDKVKVISRQLQIDPDDLMCVMWLESGLNSHIVNALAVKAGIEGATGLIQFMPSTAKSLGTTTTKLKNMTNVEQLDYVYKFFKPYVGRIKDFTTLYMITFYPVSVKHQDDDKWIFGSEQSLERAKVVRNWNPGFDVSGNGYITMSDFKIAIYNRLPKPESRFMAMKKTQVSTGTNTQNLA